MPIPVICPGCHARFQVNEKFGGKQGPCPKCKTIINIPKADEQVKIHAPEDYGGGGATDASGQPILKPIARVETHVNSTIAVAIGAAALLTVGAAFIAGRMAHDETGIVNASPILLGCGAVALAVPLVLAGYSFLREAELKSSYRGSQLLIRAAICGAVYAILWGAEAVVKSYFPDAGATLWLYAGAPFFLVGGLAAYSCLDLEFGTAVLHYAFYLVVTVLLRLVMGMTPL